MENEPLVSVLMTAYNREKYIFEAIQSVIASTYRNWELIIVDDCSIDATFKIATEFAKNDSRISVFVNETNLGDYPNRNHAASLARGEFIIYVDSDDKILPDGIKCIVQSMLLFPNASFGMYSTSNGNPFELQSVDAIKKHFFANPFLIVGPGGTIQRRSFFKEISGYPIKYGPANDMYYNLKVCCFSSIVMLPFEFMYYRRHDGQEINNASSYLYNNYCYLKDVVAELPLPLTVHEKEWINKKNKRRFSVNITKYFLKTLSVSKTRYALKMASFTVRDFLEGIFH